MQMVLTKLTHEQLIPTEVAMIQAARRNRRDNGFGALVFLPDRERADCHKGRFFLMTCPKTGKDVQVLVRFRGNPRGRMFGPETLFVAMYCLDRPDVIACKDFSPKDYLKFDRDKVLEAIRREYLRTGFIDEEGRFHPEPPVPKTVPKPSYFVPYATPTKRHSSKSVKWNHGTGRAPCKA